MDKARHSFNRTSFLIVVLIVEGKAKGPGNRSNRKMKFAKYLEETQTPEWKRAYIDYRGLKKKIAAIRHERVTAERHSLRSTPIRVFNQLRDRSHTISIVTTTPQNHGDAQHRSVIATPIERGAQPARSPLTFRTPSTTEGILNKTPGTGPSGKVYGTFAQTPPREQHLEGTNPPEMGLPLPIQSVPEQPEPEEGQAPGRSDLGSRSSFALPPPALPPPVLPPLALPPPQETPARAKVHPNVTPKRRLSLFPSLTAGRLRTPSTASAFDRGPATLAELYETLSPLERDFFNTLDCELAKVDQFFVARERDALIKISALREQMRELKNHRKVYHQYTDAQGRLTNLATIPGIAKFTPLAKLLQQRGRGHIQERTNRRPPAPPTSPNTFSTNTDGTGPGPGPAIVSLQLDPEEYQHAKKKLKKAVLELYRGVELLHNYRILNLTGLRKALKKYDKTTGRRASQLYHHEKIESSVFAESTTLDDLLKELENTYATRFEGGDQKKARMRLRASMRDRSRHFSTFRSGLYIGLSLPALISGIYESFQGHTRAAIPAWWALLQTYMALFVPVVFGLLLALNILIWSRYHINYVFIFALDVRTALDPHEYLELPAFLFFALSYCFWFSFSGLPLEVSPTSWPLAWIIFAILVIINPLPVLYKESRKWLLRTLGSLFFSGGKGVEFKDFFLGDQLCSMVYTISSLYGIGCAYRYKWQDPLEKCNGGSQWIVLFVLSVLPYLIRLIQCVKRYTDSGVVHHLVNGGKYTAGIIYYCLYLYWRSRGSSYDFLFAIWVVWSVFASTYSAVWDLIMDWSVLSKEPQCPLLRKELIYVNHVWVYYTALTTNVVLRYSWVIYISPGGPNAAVRAGIVATLEALRRFQWNFFRVENEHLGNADQYRVTREIPLPYQFDLPDLSDDDDDDDDKTHSRRRSRRRAAAIDREDQ